MPNEENSQKKSNRHGTIFWQTEDPEMLDDKMHKRLLDAQAQSNRAGAPLVVAYDGSVTKTFFAPGSIVEVKADPKTGKVRLDLAMYEGGLIVEGVGLPDVCSVCLGMSMHRQLEGGSDMCRLLLATKEGEMPSCHTFKIHAMWDAAIEEFNTEKENKKEENHE